MYRNDGTYQTYWLFCWIFVICRIVFQLVFQLVFQFVFQRQYYRSWLYCWENCCDNEGEVPTEDLEQFDNKCSEHILRHGRQKYPAELEPFVLKPSYPKPSSLEPLYPKYFFLKLIVLRFLDPFLS
ncbi:MAG: hypothetical protein LBE12_21180 [Planctomycetaceae bacterium]|nr:hypothetical protein [Planctomycetaceae bacterium]